MRTASVREDVVRDRVEWRFSDEGADLKCVVSDEGKGKKEDIIITRKQN